METNEFKDYLTMLKRRWHIITLIVLLTTIGAGLYSYLVIKPTYEASTKLIVNVKQNVGLLGELKLDDINSNMKLVDTYKEIIKTPPILDKVAAQYPELSDSTSGLNQKISVNSVNGTQVMTVKVRDQSYEKAAKIANAVSVVFKQEIPSIMKIDNVTILSLAKADANPAPVAPNKVLNILVAFVLSLMVGAGLAFALEFMDDTLKTESDIERYLGLSTLTTVYSITKSDITSKSNRNYKRVGEPGYATINQ
ncbi:YveK family protein [Paenibacillus gansuensis]|uniref:YveK family protein n=1 Tax=Paenibacillus gansuensis TaxID=306542 RepID=A0ABW5P855_9BACL